MDINSLKRDARAMRDGEWVSPGPEYGTLEIKTRALGPRFQDARAGAMKLAARAHLTEDRIPSEERERIVTEALITECLLDVRGLTEGGQPVDFKRFCVLVRDPAYGELNNAAFIAAGLVGRARQAATTDAVGNSLPASASG
jgi:hypothetical protein